MKWMPWESTRPRATPAAATGAHAVGTAAVGTAAVGSIALGAIAVGALAIGTLAIGRLLIGRVRVRRLEIDELVVRRVVVADDPLPVTTSPTFREATPSDVDRCFEIEISAYEGDEAATREKIATRIAQYPQGFLVMELAGEVIGFINCGCAHEVVLANEAFKELVGHDAQAPNVVVMSVAIDPAHQGKGYATPMMRRFVQNMLGLGKTSIHLMCKERHVALYAHMGYRYLKPSASDHGGMTWHEMVMDLRG